MGAVGFPPADRLANGDGDAPVEDVLAVVGSLAFFALCGFYAKAIDMMAGA
jgi:hypothetical protein